jgi:hypothetical protein
VTKAHFKDSIMPNATVRVNAQTLPKSPPPADDRPQSSRRGFLRFLGALAPAVGLAGVPARAAARGPTEDPASLASGARAVAIEIDPALVAIARRAVPLEEEYQLARQARIDARQTFYDLCGPVPKALRIKGGDVATSRDPNIWRR